MTYLVRTNGTATSTTTFTISTWVKRSELAGDRYVFAIANNNGSSPTEHIHLRFASDKLQSQFYISNSQVGQIETNAVYRDPSAWYHIVFRFDSTQSTANDRMRLYINGEETSLGTQTMPSQNASCAACSGGRFSLSTSYSGTGNPFKGYMSQFIYADGQSYAPTTFGSTNANGIWVANTSPSVTYGNNGFKLDFTGTGTSADSSGFGADSSGNNNHFASNNLGTNPNTKDGPENNFCTLNPLQKTTSVTLSSGNLIATNTANDQGAAGTMSFSAGKWYWEVKLVNKVETGINLDSDILQLSNDGTLGSNDSNLKQTALVTNSAGGSNDFRFNGSTETVNSTACSNGDILMVAVDADNTKIYFGKNGTWMNSGDPAGGTGELKNFSSGYTAGNFITPTFQNGIGTTASCQFNFGQPPFAIASSNADANGEGSFEYAVPSGYYALCTNNLALYGG